MEASRLGGQVPGYKVNVGQLDLPGCVQAAGSGNDGDKSGLN